MKKRNKFLSIFLSILVFLGILVPSLVYFGANDNPRSSKAVYNEYPDGDPQNPRYPDQGSTGLDKTAEWVTDEANVAKINLKLQGIPKTQGVDIVLLVDKSGSMGGNKNLALREASENFINRMYQNNEDGSKSDHRISFLWFGSSAIEAISGSGFANYTKQADLISQAKSIPSSDSSTDYGGAFNLSRDMINNRTDKSRPVQIVFMTDGGPNGSAYQATVDSLKNSGVNIHAINLMSPSTLDILRPIASTPESTYLHNVQKTSDLSPVFDAIAKNAKIAGTKAIIEDTIGDNFELIESHPSIPEVTSPKVTQVDGTGNKIADLTDTVEKLNGNRTLKWTRGDITRDAAVLTYYVKVKDGTPANKQYPVGKDKGSKVEYLNFNDVGVLKYFGNPMLPYPGGQIELFPYLVNDSGQPLSDIGGSVVPEADKGAFAKKLFDTANPIYFDDGSGNSVLPLGKSYTVDPNTQPGKLMEYNGQYFEIHSSFISSQTYTLSGKNNVYRLYIGYTVAKEVSYNVTHIYKDESGKEISALTKKESGKGPVGSKFKATENIIPGYKFSSSTPNQEITLDSDENKNTITMEYEIDKSYKGDEYKGKANYYLGQTGSTKVSGITKNPAEFQGYPGQEFIIDHPTLIGYTLLDNNQPKAIKLSYQPNDLVEKDVRYTVDTKSKDYSHTISYKLEGTKDDVPTLIGNNPEKITGYPGMDVKVAHPKAPGYIVSNGSTETSTKLSMDPNNRDTESTVYYKVDPNSKDFKGEITYLLDGTKNPVPGLSDLIVGLDKTTGVLNVSGGRGVDITISKPKVPLTGYKPVDKQADILKLPLVTTDTAKETIYYEIDKDVKFNYKINYKFADTKGMIPGMAKNPFTGNGYLTQQVSVDHPQVAGYKPVAGSITAYTVKNDNNQEIDVFYEVDKTSTKYTATINYKLKGTDKDVPGLAGSNPLVLKGYPGEEKTIPYPTALGYKAVDSSDNKVSLSKDPTVLNVDKTVYYEIDPNQKFGYEVKYYLEGTKTPVPGIDIDASKFPNAKYDSATGILSGTAPIETEIEVLKPISNKGYKVLDTTVEKIKVTTNSDINKKTVYYGIDDNQKFEYTIRYVKTGSNGRVLEEVKGLETVNKIIDIEIKSFKGLVLETTPQKQLKISEDPAKNIVEIRYKNDPSALYGYEVISYYNDGTTDIEIGRDKSKSNYQSDSVVPIIQPKIEGYTIKPGQQTLLLIDSDESKNIVRLEYTINKYKYEVSIIDEEGKPLNNLTKTDIELLNPGKIIEYDPITGKLTGIEEYDKEVSIKLPLALAGYTMVDNNKEITTIKIDSVESNNKRVVEYKSDYRNIIVKYRLVGKDVDLKVPVTTKLKTIYDLSYVNLKNHATGHVGEIAPNKMSLYSYRSSKVFLSENTIVLYYK